MKKIDYWLQKQRNKQAAKHIVGNTLLDVGCHEGELFEHILKTKTISGVGIDTILKKQVTHENFYLLPGLFPDDFKLQKKFHNITFLAVMEHIPMKELEKYPEILKNYLLPNGRIIITIPTKNVDYILSFLLFFNLIDGMDIDNHQDFDRNLLKTIFIKNGYNLIKEYRFELGLNMAFVFEKND